MGRSVDYLNNSEYVLYFPCPEYEGEDGQRDINLDSMAWDDMLLNLRSEIKAKCPSYYDVEEWEGREVKIILQNNLCIIGISEYCGLVSLSVAVRNLDGYDSEWQPQFAKRHAEQIRPILEKIISDLGLKRLSKVGTFSNGEAVFELVK